MNHIETETKVCKVCGRELTLDRFELMNPHSEKPYYLGTCKSCRYQYIRKRFEEKKEVKLADNIKILVHRAYKKINPERILDLSQTNIKPLAADEMFVKLMDYKDIWLSNYGRVARYIHESKEYKLFKGSETSEGAVKYTVLKNVYVDGKWVYKQAYLYAAHAVVREFVVNPDTVNNVFIWHKGNNKKDNYYRNFLSMILLRNLVKSTLLKVVRSGKKQGNVCKSYIIPAPLLYRYSYTKNILFYFFYFLFQPVKLPCCIYLFGNVRNLMSDHIFDGVFINAIFFCHTYKMLSSVMWSMVRV